MGTEGGKHDEWWQKEDSQLPPAEAMVQGEGVEEVDFVTRNDQLSHKKEKKDGRKKKKDAKEKNEGEKNESHAPKGKSRKPRKNGKKSKRGKKGSKKTSTQSQSAGSAMAWPKASRKRRILKNAAANAEEPAEELPEMSAQGEAKGKRRKRAASKAELPEPGETKAKNNKGSDGKPKTKKPKAETKKKAKPQAAEKAKAKAKAKGRARRASAYDLLLESDRRSDVVIKALMDFALGFDETYNQPENFENFKKAVRDRLAPLKTCHLNIYWTRSACGVSVLNEEGAASGKKKKKDKPTKKSKDIHHFNWNSIKASSVRLTAVAVRSAELAAP